jgi:hypothetical protein
MTDQFAFLGDKRKAAIIAVAMSLGVLLLLPASLGFGSGGTIIIQEAFGQLTPPAPPLDGGEEDEEEPTTLPANASMFLLRGFIGSSLPTQSGGDIPTENNSSHIVTGRFRVFANESLVNRFVAEMNLVAINGTAINGTTFHNITIEETTPHRFELTETGNGTSTITATGSIPPVSSNLMTRIYVDGNTPIVDNVPLTISIRGQFLAIEGIDIDETTITDTRQREILSILDGQTIYGTIPRR